MRRSLLFLASVASFTLIAQDRTAVRFLGVIRSWDKDSTAHGFTMTATDTVPGALPIRAVCSEDGKCRMDLPLDKVYRIEFGASRHASQHLMLDTQGPTIKQRKWGYRVRVTVQLVPQVDQVDYSICEKPLALGSFDKKENQFTWDEAYTDGLGSFYEKLQNSYLDRKLLREPPPGSR
jgi:hypothetical protein